MTTECLDQLLSEGPIPSAEAARLLGRLRGGRPLHPSTVTRWIHHGHRLHDGTRVRLAGLFVGGKVCTTRQALLRFLAAQQPAARPQPGPDALDQQYATTPADRGSST